MKGKTKRTLNKKGKRAVTIFIIVMILLIAGIATAIIVPRQLNKEKNNDTTIGIGTVEAEETNRLEESKGDPKQEEETSKSVVESAKPKQEVEETAVAIPEEVQARGYCNSFAGYTSAIIANGGLTTQEGSYYAKSGIHINIGIEDNDDVIIEAFKNGEIDFFFMTVNKMSLICKELKEAGIDVVIPYLSDSSTGGDGIVTKAEYGSIESLKNTKIAMARNSVSSAIPVWLMNMSNLSEEEVETIIHNFDLYDSTQEAVEAFLQGKCGAVSTWDITTALEAEESQLLFSTKKGEYLVIDGLIVNKKFATENPEIVKAMVDGCIQVNNDLSLGEKDEEYYDIIRTSVPDFADYNNETMKEALASSQYLGYQKNIEVFETAKQIYIDFCKIWEQLGFETDPEYGENLFDTSVLEALAEKWEGNEVEKEKEELTAVDIDITDKEALLSKSCTILFEKDSWDFKEGCEEENYAQLDEFVKIAKVLNHMVIKVEGNISLKPGEKATEFGRTLGLKRAEVAIDYMVKHGVEAERLIPTVNLEEEPKAVSKSPKDREQERNCRISVYTGEE